MKGYIKQEQKNNGVAGSDELRTVTASCYTVPGLLAARTGLSQLLQFTAIVKEIHVLMLETPVSVEFSNVRLKRKELNG